MTLSRVRGVPVAGEALGVGDVLGRILMATVRSRRYRAVVVMWA